MIMKDIILLQGDFEIIEELLYFINNKIQNDQVKAEIIEDKANVTSFYEYSIDTLTIAISFIGSIMPIIKYLYKFQKEKLSFMSKKELILKYGDKSLKITGFENKDLGYIDKFLNQEKLDNSATKMKEIK